MFRVSLLNHSHCRIADDGITGGLAKINPGFLDFMGECGNLASSLWLSRGRCVPPVFEKRLRYASQSAYRDLKNGLLPAGNLQLYHAHARGSQAGCEMAGGNANFKRNKKRKKYNALPLTSH